MSERLKFLLHFSRSPSTLLFQTCKRELRGHSLLGVKTIKTLSMWNVNDPLPHAYMFEKVGFKESERNLVKISSVHSSTILTRMYSLYECRVAK